MRSLVAGDENGPRFRRNKKSRRRLVRGFERPTSCRLETQEKRLARHCARDGHVATNSVVRYVRQQRAPYDVDTVPFRRSG